MKTHAVFTKIYCIILTTEVQGSQVCRYVDTLNLNMYSFQHSTLRRYRVSTICPVIKTLQNFKACDPFSCYSQVILIWFNNSVYQSVTWYLWGSSYICAQTNSRLKNAYMNHEWFTLVNITNALNEGWLDAF